MIGEIIKEYLVSLGVKVDKPGFNQMQTTLNQTSGVVTSATSGWAKDFVKAGAIISTALASVSASIAGVMTAVAKHDLAMEKYASSMLVSKSAAMEMKMAIDALGESIQDIQLTPELMDRYRALVADGRSMKVGGDYEGTMRNFRDLIFEFTRLKQEASYALQWVGYYLMKHLAKPLADAKKSFKSFNDGIIKNMPVWTEKVARALVYVINIGKHFLDLLKAIGKTVYEVWDSFPRGIKIATAALAGFFMLLRASPLGRMVALFSSLLLLVDDYFGYMEGKQAAMGATWDKLNSGLKEARKYAKQLGVALSKTWKEQKRFWDELKKSKGYALFLKILNDLFEFMKQTLETLVDLLGTAFGEIGKAIVRNGVLDSFKNMFYEIGKAIDDVLNNLTAVMKQLGLLSSDSRYKGFWSWFGDELSRQLKRLADFGSILAKLVQLNAALMSGEFKKAGAISRSILGDVGSIFGSYFDDGSKAEASSYQNGKIEGLSAEEQEAEPYIQDAAKEFNVDPNLLRALVKAESNFNPNAVSPVGARGYAQLMPETAKGLKVDIDDPRDNIRGGAKYLREQLDTFNNNVELALAAYNAGPQAVKDYGYTIPPYKETENYVSKVLRFAEEYRNRIVYNSPSADVPAEESIKNPPDGMREPTWRDKLQKLWRNFFSPNTDDSSATSLVRPSSYFAGAFANADQNIVSALIHGKAPAYAQGYGGNIIHVTYQVDVGGVQVKNTNASAEDIGREVGNKTASSIHGRAEYFKMNRVLNRIQV